MCFSCIQAAGPCTDKFCTCIVVRPLAISRAFRLPVLSRQKLRRRGSYSDRIHQTKLAVQFGSGIISGTLQSILRAQKHIFELVFLGNSSAWVTPCKISCICSQLMQASRAGCGPPYHSKFATVTAAVCRMKFYGLFCQTWTASSTRHLWEALPGRHARHVMSQMGRFP